MATYEQLLDAARRADRNGDKAAARRFLELAAAQRPRKSIGQVLKENIVGDDDPTTQNVGEKIGTLLNMGGEALTLGLFGDEAAAKVDDFVGRGSYDDRLAFYRGNEAQVREENPVLSLGAEIAPAALLPASAAARGVGLLSSAVRGAGAAGAAGAIYGFNEGEGGLDDRLGNAASVGLLSSVLGFGAPYAARGIEKMMNSYAARKALAAAARSAPSGDDLRAMAGPIFQRADQAQIPRAGLMNAANDAASTISGRPINPRLLPKTAGVMDELTDIATAPTSTLSFGDLEDVRRLTAIPRGDFTNPAEQRAGGIIADKIDEFVDKVDPALGKEIAEARSMWQRLRKNDMVEEAIAKAQNQASGFENGLRVQFRAILNNKKKRAGLTKAEVELMERIVQGTWAGNLMKRIGKLGFGRGQQTNVLSGTAGAAVFGPASLLAGQAALAASEGLTARNARLLSGLVRAGGMPNPPTIAQYAPQLPGLLTSMFQRAAPLASEAYMAR